MINGIGFIKTDIPDTAGKRKIETLTAELNKVVEKKVRRGRERANYLRIEELHGCVNLLPLLGSLFINSF